MNVKRVSYITGIVILTVLIGIVAVYGYVSRLTHEPGRHADTFLVYIEPGDNLSTLAEYASVAGVVDEPWKLKLVAYIYGLQNKIYAGEYEVSRGLSALMLLKKIAAQQTYKRRLIIPEGHSVKQIFEILSSSFGIDMTGFDYPQEGSLLPETYFYERGTPASDLIARMQQAMTTAIDTMWENRTYDLPLKSKDDAIILASIVEKETGVASERRSVAGVFINRLRAGMRLQSDPTIIYGITEGLPLGRPITRKDLRTDTPYNSYMRDGLPPTAITNPGKQSLDAVLNPANVPFLYFVADGSGGHAFSVTLEEHNRNVAQWRQIEREQKQ